MGVPYMGVGWLAMKTFFAVILAKRDCWSMSQALSKQLQAFTPPEEMLLLIPTRRICWRLSFHRLFCYGGQHWAAQTRAALLCKTFKSNKMGSARTLADWLSAEGLESDVKHQRPKQTPEPSHIHSTDHFLSNCATVKHTHHKTCLTKM